jgi:DNA-binding transcriptional ArsR family regulator
MTRPYTPTEQRILTLLSKGPMSLAGLCAAIGMSDRNVGKLLRKMRGEGIVKSEAGPKGRRQDPGHGPLVWALVADVDLVGDERWPPAKHGFGTNPPGRELDQAWRGRAA